MLAAAATSAFASSNCATRPSSTFASTVPPDFLRAGVVSNGSADEQRAVRQHKHVADSIFVGLPARVVARKG